MNYILQLNGFWNWARTNEISHLELDLYMSILDIANSTSWKTQFSIPNSSLGRFDKNSLTRARNKLVQYGLINYNKGKKGQAPTYQVIQLYDDINPNNDTYIDTNNDTNMHTNIGTNIGNIHKLNKTKLNKTINPIIPYEKVVDLFNTVCVSLPKVEVISEGRKRAIKLILKKYTLEDLGKVFEEAEKSDFLRGDNNRKWTATFDWLIKENNIIKVMEKNFTSNGRDNFRESDTAFMDGYDHSALEQLSRR